MSNLPLIVSPSDNSDWNLFLQTQPDLTDVICWLKNKKLNFEKIFEIEFSSDDPEEVFEIDELMKWARDNDFVSKDRIIDILSEQINLLKK